MALFPDREKTGTIKSDNLLQGDRLLKIFMTRIFQQIRHMFA